MKETRNYPRLPMLLTLPGIAIGLLLSLLAVWADYESTSYGFFRRAQASFRGLSCPVFMGKNESKTVSLRVANPTDRTLSPGVWTQVSTTSDPESKIDHVQLAPGEHVTLQRTVGPGNVDLGMFIFVDALVYSVYPLPDRQTTCGILVLPLPNGMLLLVFGTALSIALMAAGTYLLYKDKGHSRRSRAILFVVIATVLAMAFGYIGLWLAALVLIILSFLALLISAGDFYASQTVRN